MKLRLFTVLFALLFLLSCGEETEKINFDKGDCIAGKTSQVLEYINDLKGEELFKKEGDKYKIAKDSIRYNNEVLPLQKANVGIHEDYYRLYLAKNMMPTDELIDWEDKHLIYLLLDTEPCALLLEIHQVNKKLIVGNTSMEKTIELTIWQKHEKEWFKVTKDFFPLEEFRERLTMQYPLIEIKDNENTLTLDLTEYNQKNTFFIGAIGRRIPAANPIVYLENSTVQTLVWKNNHFEFLVPKENAKELVAVFSGVKEELREVVYTGVLNGEHLVKLTMDLKPKENGNTAVTGSLEVRGHTTYTVEGSLFNKNYQKAISLKLLTNNGTTQVLNGIITNYSTNCIRFDPIEKDSLFSTSLVLCHQKTKDLLLNRAVNSLDAYANEIFELLEIPNGEYYNTNKKIEANFRRWNSNKAFFHEINEDYQLVDKYDEINAKEAISNQHNLFTISDYGDLTNEGEDQYEVSKYGTVQHILLDSKKATVLEIGTFVDTVEVSYPDTEREGDDGELIRDSDIDGVYFVYYMRVLERSPEGYWVNINKKVMPEADELLKAMQFFYPQLSDTDYFYNYTRTLGDDQLPQRTETLLNYQAKIEGRDGIKTERSFDPTVFQVEWKNNTLYIAGENGIQLQWNGQQFLMETNAVMNIKTENCFNVDQLKFNKEQKVNYVGNINNEYAIEMAITFGRDNDGGFLNGTYWYTNNNQPIEVSGDYNPYTKEVTILHYKEGKISETFLGKYGNDCRITGTWTKGEKKLPFSIGEKVDAAVE